MAELGFPLWLRLTHYFNFLLITLLIRSGFQILSEHPRLYWNDYSEPGTEWIRFTKKKVPQDRLYTSLDDAISVPSWLALPGGRHRVGACRHWHFFSVFFWLLNGFVYIVCLFSTDHWKRLIPTSFKVFPHAWQVFVNYLHFQSSWPEPFRPYNALQQLTYAAVVFGMAPLIILTGLLQSPAIAGRFPWSVQWMGGHQPARSLHFILTMGFILFTGVHLVMVLVENFQQNMLHIVLGHEHGNAAFAIILGLCAIISVVLINMFFVWWSNRAPRTVQHVTGFFVESFFMKPLALLKSRQHYSQKKLGRYFWVNGYPPDQEDWLQLSKKQFRDYQLEVSGLVEKPLLLSLNDLQAMRKEVQLTEHICIQGWSGFAEWGGVPVSEIVKLCRPKSLASWIIFHSYQYDKDNIEYYTSMTLAEAEYPQTILAYEMNGQPLPIEHGAPLRLRMETMLGFKMCKWIKSIEFVEKLSDVGLGYGGYHEDREYCSVWARL